MEKFFQKMRLLLKDEFHDFMESREQPAYRGLRVNGLKCKRETLVNEMPFSLKPVPFCDDGFYLPDEISGIGNHPLHCAGAFYVQEPSAMSAVTMLKPEKGDFVLDLCAAPGGKSAQIAASLDGEGLLWSNEIVKNRANTLLSNIERLGVRNAVISSCHPQKLCEGLMGCFDKILVDAPCSGEGMFRKHEKAILEWSEENVVACARRQLQILESAKLALKSGGVIVYSTCTFSEEENEGVIINFLKRNPEFVLEDSKVQFGRNTLGFAKRIFPMDGGEGHFAAKLRHTGKHVPSGGNFKNYFKRAGAEAEKMYETVFPGRPFGDCLTQIGDKIIVLPKSFPALEGLGVLRAGVLLGEVCKNRIEPSHCAFMAAKPEDCAAYIELKCKDERLNRFLHGEEIDIDISFKGYAAVCVCGIITGFGKASGGVLKNKYPKGLRLIG